MLRRVALMPALRRTLATTSARATSPTDEAKGFLAETRDMMEKNVVYFQGELDKLHCGRARPGILDDVSVEAYGARMPLVSLATVTARSANLLHVSVHDQSLCGSVKKAIDSAGLGFNANLDGTTLTVPIPKASKETRENLVKVAASKAEKARVDLRQSRKAGLDKLKKVSDALGDDDAYRLEKEIQSITDTHMDTVTSLYAKKEKELRNE
ncbi:Ribosome recycling factor domain-containing protein [Plasmodiophora brassicae]|uniref:Ribosome recycling factor domain-containing protein n=1 Tax=Plasmodiophora brassicae TaxID=37360 RepID=A0A0G4J195_PLABS|nr:hypothetical protein PBRA_008398 [Plasmodiophora brassicae]SPR01246.1 unnamed protein product [Plasmodiophora brassicae]